MVRVGFSLVVTIRASYLISTAFHTGRSQTSVRNEFWCGQCLLLSCKAGATRTDHYQLVRALSAGAVVTVL